jgi:hypothetical protein
VREIKGNVAVIKLLIDKNDTREPVDSASAIEVPISTLTPLEELLHWHLQCKICGGSHRDPEPAIIPPTIRRGSMPIRMPQQIACPKFPDKSEIYTHEDWCLLTQSEFRELLKERQEETRP